jgi:pSer/pThr/pTyr-binding forkhead associated (FHA) protein
MNNVDADKTALNSDSTLFVSTSSQEATVLSATVECPVCKEKNPPSEKYCIECGFLLSSVPGEAAEIDFSRLPRLVDVRTQQDYLLRQGENTVGRENTDVLLSDSTVSRRHALIILDADKCWIEDLGSTNGTYIGGVRINRGERVEVRDGTEISFGSVTLSLRLPGFAKEVTLASDVAEISDEAVDEQKSGDLTTAGPEASPGFCAFVAKLVSVSEPSTEYLVKRGVNTIGRRTENDISLQDPYVSGRHAELLADDEGFWLTDVGSTNGTLLNGSRISPNTRIAINPGDEVIFGKTTLRLELLSQTDGKLEG